MRTRVDFASARAYRQATESTIYLRHGLEGKGSARRSTRADPAHLRARLPPLVGAIALPNDPSVQLHERLGFAPAGRWSDRIQARPLDRRRNWQLERASD
jgi:phosphinothricin acetyltransferase